MIFIKLESMFILNLSIFLSLTSSNNGYCKDSTKHVFITIKSVLYLFYVTLIITANIHQELYLSIPD